MASTSQLVEDPAKVASTSQLVEDPAKVASTSQLVKNPAKAQFVLYIVEELGGLRAVEENENVHRELRQFLEDHKCGCRFAWTAEPPPLLGLKKKLIQTLEDINDPIEQWFGSSIVFRQFDYTLAALKGERIPQVVSRMFACPLADKK